MNKQNIVFLFRNSPLNRGKRCKLSKTIIVYSIRQFIGISTMTQFISIRKYRVKLTYLDLFCYNHMNTDRQTINYHLITCSVAFPQFFPRLFHIVLFTLYSLSLFCASVPILQTYIIGQSVAMFVKMHTCFYYYLFYLFMVSHAFDNIICSYILWNEWMLTRLCVYRERADGRAGGCTRNGVRVRDR